MVKKLIFFLWVLYYLFYMLVHHHSSQRKQLIKFTGILSAKITRDFGQYTKKINPKAFSLNP